MFLCAQARPRFDPATKSIWDGKIGIWPIGNYDRAKRSSANRPAGTEVWKNAPVDKSKYKEMMTEYVIPAIIDKWPKGEFSDPEFKVRIQQDNAPAHDDKMIANEIQQLVDGGKVPAGKIQIYNQPPNSPDLNILDLGLFNAVQSAYWRHAPKNSGEIIECVKKTYEEYPLSSVCHSTIDI